MKKFIIFEGSDFCGKTTVLDKIMTNHLIDPICFNTREPGSLLMPSMYRCEKYRQQLLFNKNTLEEEVSLFAESRLVHTKDIIKYLEINNVISDRYIVSSLAYQGYAQGFGKDIIFEYNKEALDLLRENNIQMHIIKFNISEKEWLYRKNKRKIEQKLDEIESKNINNKILDFFTTDYIYEYYTKELNAMHYNIDANQSEENVYNQVMEIINNIIGG